MEDLTFTGVGSGVSESPLPVAFSFRAKDKASAERLAGKVAMALKLELYEVRGGSGWMWEATFR